MMTESEKSLLWRARMNAEQSLDPSTKVGGVIQVQGGPAVFGHNTFVGLDDPATATREERYADVVHAEEVALMRAGRRAEGATYVGTHEPCARCYRRLTLAGVVRILFPVTSPERRERWGCDDGRRVAEAQGVEVVEVVA